MEPVTVIREVDLAFAELLFKHRGVVFGGYLRDMVAGDEPRDIDVVVSQFYYSDFHKDMLSSGYTCEEVDVDHYLYKKKGSLPAEVIVSTDNPDSVVLGPDAYPDFDVNLLTYNGDYLYNWMTASDDTRDIAAAIKSRAATALEGANEYRREKMLGKAYDVR